MLKIAAVTVSMYTPLAGASTISTNLGTLSLPFGILTSDNALAGNSSFSDYWSFTIGSNAFFAGSEVSTVITETSEIPGYAATSISGTAISSLQLFNGVGTSGALIAEALSTTNLSDPYYPFGSTIPIYRTTDTYNAFLNNVSLNAGTYTLAVNGQVFGDAAGSFSGSFSLIPNNSQPAAVPLPPTIWLLGSALGVLSFRTRKKKPA
ncbi:hypothetical protein [Methylomonas sp. MgM2]